MDRSRCRDDGNQHRRAGGHNADIHLLHGLLQTPGCRSVHYDQSQSADFCIHDRLLCPSFWPERGIWEGVGGVCWYQFLYLVAPALPHVEGGGDTEAARSTQLAQGSLNVTSLQSVVLYGQIGRKFVVL